jgi:hypothetical protein
MQFALQNFQVLTDYCSLCVYQLNVFCFAFVLRLARSSTSGRVTLPTFRSPTVANAFYRLDNISSLTFAGHVPNTAPTVSGGGGPAWSGFVVTNPWQTCAASPSNILVCYRFCVLPSLQLPNLRRHRHFGKHVLVNDQAAAILVGKTRRRRAAASLDRVAVGFLGRLDHTSRQRGQRYVSRKHTLQLVLLPSRRSACCQHFSRARAA